MEAVHFLRDLLIVFAAAGATVFAFQRLRLPSVVGLLAAGMLVGPHCLGLVHDGERIRLLAEVGVAVLLFAVGLEFSIPRLAGMGWLMAGVGVPQVLLCGLAGVAATWWYFADVGPAIFIGMLLAMSSTAVVFKLLTDRGELTSPQGNVTAAVLLFQDLLVVACMVLLPLLAGKQGEGSLGTALGLGALVVIGMLVVGRFLVPLVLYQVVRTHNRELFLIVLVLLCLGSSALTASMGWSLALGAFLAGLALSESDYATQTLAEVLPFRDTLASLFFISMGMLVDLQFLGQHLPLVGALVAGIVLVKFAAAGLPVLAAGFPLRIAVLAGVALAQVGEFSFILADRGLALGIVNQHQHQAFLAAAVLSMVLTPALIAAGPRLAEWLAAWPLPESWRDGRLAAGLAEKKVAVSGHVVILGFGVNGRNLARVLRAVNVEYVVLELNPHTVRVARRQGEPVYYGDCMRPVVLEHLGIGSARVLVVGISDAVCARRAVQLARQANPLLHIIARTRYLAEVNELRKLGANAVIPEEFEAAVEISARVLREYEVPHNLILDLVDQSREEHYEALRDIQLPTKRASVPHLNILEKMEIQPCWIRDSSPARDQTLHALNLRAETGATLVAVRRSGKLLLNPGPDHCFLANDIAILMGERSQVDRAVVLLDPLLLRGQQKTSSSHRRAEPGA